MNLAAIGLFDSSATGDCPGPGTRVLCAAGTGCEFVTNNIAPFLQNLVDKVRLSRIYVLDKLEQQAGFNPLFK